MFGFIVLLLPAAADRTSVTVAPQGLVTAPARTALVQQNLRTEEHNGDSCNSQCNGHKNDVSRATCFRDCNNRLLATARENNAKEQGVANADQAAKINAMNAANAAVRPKIIQAHEAGSNLEVEYKIKQESDSKAISDYVKQIEKKVPPVDDEVAKITKDGEKSLELQAKQSEKDYKEQETVVEDKTEVQVDKNEDMIEAGEKANDKTEKEDDKVISKLEAADEKEIAKEETKIEKEDEKTAKMNEKNDEKITEEEDVNQEIASTLAEVSDTAAAGMERAMSDQETAGEDAEMLRDAYQDTLETKLEEVMNEGSISVGEIDKGVQETIKDSVKAMAESSETTNEGLAELSKGVEKLSDETDSVLMEHEKALIVSQKDQHDEAKRLENDAQKTQQVEESTKDKAGELVNGLKDAVVETIQRDKAYGQQEITEHQATLVTDIAKKKEGALKQILKGTDQIETDTEGSLSQIASQFEGDYNSMSSKLSKAQRDFEQTRQGVMEDEKATMSGVETVDKLDTTAGPELARFAQTATRAEQSTLDQAGEVQEDILSNLGSSLGSATEQVKNDANTARSGITEGYNEITEETDKGEEGIQNKATDISKTYSDEVKKVSEMLKPIETQQNQAQQQLRQVNEDLGTLNGDTQSMQDQMGKQLVSIQERVMTASEKSNADLMSHFAEDEAYAQQHMDQLQQAMASILGQQRNNFENQAKGVGTSLEKSEENEGARRKTELDKVNALSNEISGQEVKVTDTEAKLQPEYQDMADAVNTAHAKIEGIQKEAEKARAAFSSTMKKKTADKVKELQTDVMKQLDDGMKETSEQTKDLGDNVKEQEQQAEVETETAMKQVDSSIHGTQSTYDQILGKVETLRSHEQALTGTATAQMQRADDAIALLEKDGGSREAEMEKLDAEYESGEAKATDEINTFEETKASERSAYTQKLLAEIESVERKREAAQKELDAKMGVMDGDARTASDLTAEEEQRMREAIARGEMSVEDAMKAGLTNIHGLERQVDGKTQEELRTLSAMSLETAEKRTAERAEQADVERDLAAENRAVGSEIGQVGNAVERMLHQIDPTAELAVVQNSVLALQGLSEHASAAERAKVGQVEGDVKATADKINTILAAATMQAGSLSKEVMATAVEARDKLQDLRAKLAVEQEGVRNLAAETCQTATELDNAQDGKLRALQQRVEGMNTQLEAALGLQKYQSGDALKKVLYILDKAVTVDEGLIKERDEVIVPTTKTWRGQVERVFESMNMALDLGKVERMAAMSLAAEQANGPEGMMNAKEKMDKEIAAVKQKMQLEIDWVRENAKNKIAEIEADASLSAKEKEARIAAIKKKADADVYKLTLRTKKLISDQYMSGHKLDEEIHELHNLLERATNVAGQGTAESAAWAKAMMKEVTKRLESLRERYVNTYSLAQLQQRVRDAGAKVDAAVAGNPPPVNPFVAKTAAVTQAGHDLISLIQEHESEDASWNQALDALMVGVQLLKETKAKGAKA